MSKQRGSPRQKARFQWWMLAPLLLVVAMVAAVQLRKNKEGQARPSAAGRQAAPPNPGLSATPSQQPTSTPAAVPSAPEAAPAEAPSARTIEVNQAVMVTVELDFGGTVPTIAEALQQIERRYYPEDGVGRTFAILDAYGMPMEDNKLHMSMHLSTEKSGAGMLVFKRTGEVLWENTIIESTHSSSFARKNLLILVDNGEGKNRSWTIDGSNNPTSILDARVKEKGQPLRELWPDGTDREFTYLYSACGCPVKAMVRREGERTYRTSDQPVMFPDDPDALRVIRTLMGWDA